MSFGDAKSKIWERRPSTNFARAFIKAYKLANGMTKPVSHPMGPSGSRRETLYGKQHMLEPGADAVCSLPHPSGSREYVSVVTGTLLLTLVDGHQHMLNAGASFFYDADHIHTFANPSDRKPCVYSVSPVPRESDNGR
jgi:mannose-6-phosphate isomerase-like protein (cupin superfamily)